MNRVRMLALLLSLVGSVLAVWLALVVVPDVQETVSRQNADLERFRTRADTLMAASLGAALFERDYGDLQESLVRFMEAGFVARAAVTNADKVVVAGVGALPGARIGEPLAVQSAADIRRMPLRVRSEDVGEISFVTAIEHANPGAVRQRIDLMTAAMRVLAVVAVLALAVFAASVLRLR